MFTSRLLMNTAINDRCQEETRRRLYGRGGQACDHCGTPECMRVPVIKKLHRILIRVRFPVIGTVLLILMDGKQDPFLKTTRSAMQESAEQEKDKRVPGRFSTAVSF
jgi:hypothetical protein